jgi:hypothetical protein
VEPTALVGLAVAHGEMMADGRHWAFARRSAGAAGQLGAQTIELLLPLGGDVAGAQAVVGLCAPVEIVMAVPRRNLTARTSSIVMKAVVAIISVKMNGLTVS